MDKLEDMNVSLIFCHPPMWAMLGHYDLTGRPISNLEVPIERYVQLSFHRYLPEKAHKIEPFFELLLKFKVFAYFWQHLFRVIVVQCPYPLACSWSSLLGPKLKYLPSLSLIEKGGYWQHILASATMGKKNNLG